MINGYTIRKVNGKEVMYLFFDFNYEFSNFDFMAKREKIHDVVKNFIRDHNIIFKGATIALVAGGVLFGSINLSEPSISQISENNNVTIEEHTNIPSTDPITIANNIQEENIENKTNEIKENTIETQNINNESNNTSISETTNIPENTQVSETTNNVETPVETVEPEIIEEDNNIYVNVKRNNGEISKIELEEYVIGVVGAEMPALFDSEALKAQAIIARTYALKAIQTGKTLSDNESTQSYKDNWQLSNTWGNNYESYYNKVRQAVISTNGMYLTYNGNYIDAVYHSTSNGKTEDSTNVWGNYFPYLVSVDSPYDNTNPSFSISKTFSYEELSNKLGTNIDENTEFNILGYTSGGRVDIISINEKKFTGVKFRSILGLRSADFDITKNEGNIIITTRGYGHGVGMSQYGANGMAKAGYNYQDILYHYYNGVSIQQL